MFIANVKLHSTATLCFVAFPDFICRQQQKAFLIMDWIEGLSLEELLYRQPLPPDIALHLSRQLVDAVSFCHQQGVVHGDIKPANIIISPNNHLTLFDFGISRSLVS